MRHLLFILLLTSLGAACTSVPPQPEVTTVPTVSPQALRDAAPPSGAALAPWLSAERARVTQAREAANGRFAADETLCWQRFAVNDCLRQVRLQRRAALDQLRQQELALNEIERQRRAEQRLRQLDEKQRAAAER